MFDKLISLLPPVNKRLKKLEAESFDLGVRLHLLQEDLTKLEQENLRLLYRLSKK